MASVLAAPLWSTPARATTGPTRASQLVDVSPNNWAYRAIEDLMEKYRGILGGYPDYTFRGNRPVTRYELAAALDRLMQELQPYTAVMPQDKATLDRLQLEFAPELASLDKRVTALEGSIKAIQDQVGVIDHVHGNIGTFMEDDPQDQYFPYLATNLLVKFAGKIDAHLSYYSAISGGLPAIQTGNTPPALARLEPGEAGYTGKDLGAPPNGSVNWDNGIGSGARIDAEYPEFDGFFVKSGMFTPLENISPGGFATHWFDGLIGSGLHYPSGSSVRYVTNDVGIMSGAKFGGLGLVGEITSKMVIGQVAIDAGELDVRILGDIDHNSIGNVTIKGDQVYNFSAQANLGSSDLGLSAGGGIKGAGTEPSVPLGQVTANATILGIQTAVGFEYTSEQGIQELWPSGYVFIPMGSGSMAPSLLIGANNPQTLSAGPDPQTGIQRPGGNGSYLGHKSGITIQLGLPNAVVPDLKLEYDYKADVLFGPTYDAQGFALSSDLNF